MFVFVEKKQHKFRGKVKLRLFDHTTISSNLIHLALTVHKSN